jgi:hypothetical protein
MALADSVINTLSAWDGSSSMPGFGAFGTPTMGQTVTVPMNDTVLQSFSFELNLPASTTFASYVYEWDDRPPDYINGTGGTVAMGSRLFRSAPTNTSGSGAFEQITFYTGGLSLIAGGHYVLFVSTSEFPDSLGGGPIAAQAYFTPDWYSGGMFVFNNNDDPSQWTVPYGPANGNSWVGSFIPNMGDLAFQAQFSGVPEPATFWTSLSLLIFILLTRQRKSRV